jgi:septal ring factor EnvC (AmiA/AmiB activator)
MSRAKKALVLMVVCTMGLWGCAKGPTPGAGSPERIRSLEAKVAKLEEDFRMVASARDRLRTDLAATEEQRALLEKERDDLRQQLAARTAERDTLQVQYDGFRKTLHNLLGQADVAANKVSAPPLILTSRTAEPGK